MDIANATALAVSTGLYSSSTGFGATFLMMRGGTRLMTFLAAASVFTAGFFAAGFFADGFFAAGFTTFFFVAIVRSSVKS